MSRIQNYILFLWIVSLLFFIAFNWQVFWSDSTVNYMFMQFQLQPFLWLVLAGIGVPVALRVFSTLEARNKETRTEKEFDLLRARAFDGLSGEFQKLSSQLEKTLEDQIQAKLAQVSENKALPAKNDAETDAETEDEDEDKGGDKGDKKEA